MEETSGQRFWHPFVPIVLAPPNRLRYDARDEMRLPEPRFLFLIPLAAIALALLVTACGGGNGEEGEIGQITNPQDAPTAPPWEQPPEVLMLDPNAIPTLPAGNAPTPTPAEASEEGAEPGVCGPKYTVVSGDTFSSIATKCGATTQGMRDANPGVDPLTIRPGQVINVPAAAPEPTP